MTRGKFLGKFFPGRFKQSRELTDMYDHFNEQYFDNQLPVVRVGFYREDEEYGMTVRLDGALYPSYLCITPALKKSHAHLCITLLHEMIHVKLLNKGGHGPKFKKELKHLMRIGAYDQYL
jgi:hypothetical protein